METPDAERGGKRPLLRVVPTAVLFAVLLSACMGNALPPKPIHYYTLNPVEDRPQFDTVLPCILRVERFSVSPPFDSQRIYYADSKSHRNAYASHQWVAPPGLMLPFLLARDLRQSNGFRAVWTPDAAPAATHSVHGWVEEFIEEDDTPQWQASAVIHLTLISNLDPDPISKVMLQKVYRATAPCRKKSPSALAEAMSLAVGRIHTAAMKDIHRRLAAAPTVKY